MSSIPDSLRSISCLISKPLAIMSGAASVIGVVIICFSTHLSLIIALLFYCLAITSFTVYLLHLLYKNLSVRAKDHESQTSHIRYETIDGNHIIYEIYKSIQSKKPLMTDFDFNFKWTGSRQPEISSKFQEVLHPLYFPGEIEYDKVTLKLKRPLYYNQNCIIHFKADLDDTDHSAKKMINTRISQEVEIIHYCIILKHKPRTFNRPATLQRCLINSNIRTDYQILDTIQFDNVRKCYEYHLFKPDIGYFYKISWE